ncbi:hypothetical protein BD779DRAFT_1475162 [Infundibulicybe gibba]|nr:hypothetical protein BD779DRAFT_1475162 [Infundibulicybe gibba]
MRCSQTPRSFFALILLSQVSNAAPANQTIDDGLGVQYSPSPGSHGLGKRHCHVFLPGHSDLYILHHSQLPPCYWELRFPGGWEDCRKLYPRPDGSFEFQYDALIYADTSLSDALHTFVIQAKKDSIVIFDYARYTTDTPVSSGTIPAQPESPKLTNTTSTTSAITTTTAGATSKTGAIAAPAHPPTPPGVIAGSIIGGVMGITLIVLGAILHRRRTLIRTSLEGSLTAFAGPGSEMESGYTTPSTLKEQAKPERKSSDLRMERLLVEIEQLATQQHLVNSGGSRQTRSLDTERAFNHTADDAGIDKDEMWVVGSASTEAQDIVTPVHMQSEGRFVDTSSCIM